jgi:hypothetical protein
MLRLQRWSVCWLLPLIALAPGAVRPGARAATLEPGADLSDCRSALRPGLSNCAGPEPVARQETADPTLPTPASTAALEREVDEFLADYGKPPREAVRALLEPSEAHIRALLRKQEETLAVAAYVAARMTALQKRESSGDPDRADPARASDLPSMMRMRITLVQRARDPEAAETLDALRMLARQYPSLQVRIELVDRFEPQTLRAEIARIEAPFMVTSRAPDPSDTDALPRVRIEDLRNRRSCELDARGLSAPALRAAIVGLRRAAEAAFAARRGRDARTEVPDSGAAPPSFGLLP